jgi:hypothetical protein
VLHEVLHTLGYGSLWDLSGAPQYLSGKGGPDPVFTGASARAAFRDFDGGAGYSGVPVPVENVGGTGSRDRHWRMATFGVELMTAAVTTTGPALSRTTLESLTDLGYQVNVAAADPYVVVTTTAYTMAAALGGAPLDVVDLGGDVLEAPPLWRWP